MTDTVGGASTAGGAETAVTKPILHNPYDPPRHHWKLNEHTQRAEDVKLDGRRPSGDYLPVPKHRPDGTLLLVDAAKQVHPHTMINEIRDHVDKWRDDGWSGATRVTSELLKHWRDGVAEPRPFFCQVEAIETLVWLHEAGKRSQPKEWRRITKMLAEINEARNEGIDRVAIKMATGTGKTRLMQMLISWVAANQEHGAEFLAITPGLTVKDRLEEIKPTAGGAYDTLLPRHLHERIYRARVHVLNFQSFQKRDKLSVAGEGDKLTGTGKALIWRGKKGDDEESKETDLEMLDRLLHSTRRRRLIVLNDEAHHCYVPPSAQRRPGEDREDREFEKGVALWFNALRSLKRARQLKQVYDFSATPMYLRSPADLPSEIFPWTVTDYPLIEAIEAGLTKIPRVPVDDDSDKSEPLYRKVYEATKTAKIAPHKVPDPITSLLEQMHEHYDGHNKELEALGGDRKSVMIVVANTVKNATALYGHIAGYHDGKKWVRGKYARFSNILPDGSGPKPNPPTLLVHSGLDDPDALPQSVAKVLAKEAEIHTPGVENKTERLAKIRSIFNSVGRLGGPGENIRCIVSVSMLTEGWDARTVTHIFGYRKFGTQLLCEQVAGRGLRRTGFDCEGEDGLLPAETVNIFGIPFNFMRAQPDLEASTQAEEYHVYSMPDREEEHRIAFPNVSAYRVEVPRQSITLDPDRVERYVVEPRTVPSMTELMGLVGESHITELTEKRRRYVVYALASTLLSLLKADEIRRRELFRSALAAVQGWLSHPEVRCADHRLLLVAPHVSAVPQAIARSCTPVDTSEPAIVPVFADQLDATQPRALDTGGIDFWTTKRAYHGTEKSELNRAPCDSRSEVKVAHALDGLDGIAAWARNFRLGWQIPYFEPKVGVWKSYVPDFVARVRRVPGDDRQTHLVIEYKGQPDEDSDIKTKAVTEWWLPAVNGSGDASCPGEWRYVFIDSEEDIYPKLVREIER